MNTTQKIYTFFLFVTIVLLPILGFAQPDPCTDPDVYCPIDGGLSLLIAAGIGIGAKKAYDKKRQKSIDKL